MSKALAARCPGLPVVINGNFLLSSDALEARRVDLAADAGRSSARDATCTERGGREGQHTFSNCDRQP